MKYFTFYVFRLILSIIILPIALLGFLLGALWEFKFCLKHFAWFYQITYLPNNYDNSDKGKWIYPNWMHESFGNSSFKYINPISWAFKTKNYFSTESIVFSNDY